MLRTGDGKEGGKEGPYGGEGGRERGWQGKAKARKNCLEGYREWWKEADCWKGSSEKGVSKRTDTGLCPKACSYKEPATRALSRTEANNKVWTLNGDRKTMLHFANIYETFEDSGIEVVDVDQEVEEKTEYIQDKMEEVKQVVREAHDATKMELHRNAAEMYDKVEDETENGRMCVRCRNLGLELWYMIVLRENRVTLDKALMILRTVAAGDIGEGSVSLRSSLTERSLRSTRWQKTSCWRW